MAKSVLVWEYMDDINSPDTSILKKAGLTESQAKGYLALIEHGSLTPAELATSTGESRTNGYAIADRLVVLGLAKKAPTSSTYEPENPTQLKQLLVSRQKALKTASKELSGILPSLLSTYRLVTDRPGVLHLEGAESLKTIYDDIIKTGDTLLVIPSAEDDNDPEISQMIGRQIERQRKAGIKTRALIRPEVFAHFSTQNDDLFEAKQAPYGALETQIMIYGPNVAITTFKSGIVTTIITSEPVATTFRQLFESLWHLQPSASGTVRG